MSQRNDRVQLLLEAVSDYAIYMLDPEGRVATWNPGAARIKGYSEAEVIGQPFSLFFPPEDRERGLPEQILKAARTHGRHESEGWRLRKDGGRFWALAVIQPVRDDAGELVGYAKVTRDMTERQQAQQRLIESERRFRLLVEGVADYAIYMLDPTGHVTNWNTGAQRIKGYAADEIIGLHFSTFYPAEDRQAGVPQRALETAREHGRFEAEGWRVRKDGTRFWASVVIDAVADETGELIGFAKITRDVTERRAAEEALRESERQFRILVNGVTDYALYLLDPNGVVTKWNAGAQRIKGYTADEAVGQHVSRFYTDADREAGLPARTLATAAEEGRAEAEGWRVRKDGTTFWANVVVDAIRDETGALIGFAKITRDATERRQAQIRLQETQQRLAQAQKMEAMGQLTGGVAHDFNNLLMIVNGHADLLRRHLADDPKALKAIEAIELASHRGATLTRQLLSFARRQRLAPKSLDLAERLAALAPMLANSVDARIEIEVELPPGLWPVEVDESELELALVNLTVNARDAMPEGGRITLSAENVALEPGERNLELRGDYVALTVADTGTGIAPDILARVFDPFFTTKQVDKGTGLGLAQVHGFAHQSGGAVVVESKVGQGARMTLFLPRADVEPAAAPEAVAAPASGQGATVLLVEDNAEVAEVSAALLEQLGYRVEVTPSAQGALDLLDAGRTYDLVFSDIVMAGPLDGLGLAQKLKQERPNLPVLLASGYSKAAESAGAEFPILRKPYGMAELGQAASAVIAEARAPAAAPSVLRLRGLQRGPKAEAEL